LSSSAKASDFSTAIAGRIFCDSNCNCKIDEGIDDQLMNVTVQLFDANNNLIAVTTPAQNGGLYLFTGLEVGKKYFVHIVPAFGQTPVNAFPSGIATKVNKTTISVTVANAGDTYYPEDFLLKCCNTGFTQCDWGTNGCGFDPIDLIADSFNDIFPNGVVIGGNKTITFTNPDAIVKFLPSNGNPRALGSSKVNPGTSYSNEFAGNILALTLNVQISDAGVTGEGYGDRVLDSGKLTGYTVRQVLDMANTVLGGDSSVLPAGVSLCDLNNIVEAINEDSGCDCGCDNNYHNGCYGSNHGHCDGNGGWTGCHFNFWDQGHCHKQRHGCH